MTLKSTHVSAYLLREIGLGPTSARIIVEELFGDKHRRLRALDVSGNNLGPAGKQAVAIMVRQAPQLQKLVIDLGQINARELNRTAQACKLDLRGCGLELGDIWVAAAWVELCSSTLTVVDLSNNPSMTNDNNIRSLAQRTDSTVVPQRCQEDSWSSLCMALRETEHVQSLFLSNIGAGANCARVLAFALTATTKNKFGQRSVPLATRVTDLDISGNPFSRSMAGLEALLGPDGALQGSAINKLRIDLGCLPAETSGHRSMVQWFSGSEQQTDIETLTRSTEPLELQLRNRNLSARDLVTIAGWLKHCSRTTIVKSLDLSENPEVVGEALLRHHTNIRGQLSCWQRFCGVLCNLELQVLRLADTGLSVVSSEILAEALRASHDQQHCNAGMAIDHQSVEHLGDVPVGSSSAHEQTSNSACKLRETLVALDISGAQNPLGMGKYAIVDALPGTKVQTLTVQIGSDTAAVLDARCSSIDLSHKQLQPDDAALLAGWTAHVEQQISTVDLSDNPLLIAADDAQLEATVGCFFTAVSRAPVVELRLAHTGLNIRACNLLVDAMINGKKTKDKNLSDPEQPKNTLLSSLLSLDLGRNTGLTTGEVVPLLNSEAVGTSVSTKHQPQTTTGLLVPMSSADESVTRPSAWVRLCRTLADATVTHLDVNCCQLGPTHVSHIATVLAAKKLKSLNLSDNLLCHPTEVGRVGRQQEEQPEQQELGGVDVRGLRVLCKAWGVRSKTGAAARQKRAGEECGGGVSSLEELNAANTGIGPSALQLLATAMPARLTTLNLRDNDFGTPAVFRVKINPTTGQPKGILNANKGGTTGHTGMMKITKGVVVVDKTGCAYRVQKLREWQRTKIVFLLNLQKDEADEDDEASMTTIPIEELLRTCKAYAKEDVELGSVKHVQQFFENLHSQHSGCRQLRQLDVSGTNMDGQMVEALASSIRSLTRLESVTLDATGFGPWRGIRGRHFCAPERAAVECRYTLRPPDDADRTIDLSDRYLSPHDLVLVSAWLQLPAVAMSFEQLILSGNAQLLGNCVVDDDLDPRNILGEWRIMQRCAVRKEWATSEQESPLVCYAKAGMIVKVTQSAPAPQRAVDVGASAEKQKRDAEINAIPRLRLYCESADEYTLH